MFGTMGFSEMIIILVIVLIIFGAGKLPQIGEGVGKALKGFKKEVNDIPPPEATVEQSEAPAPLRHSASAARGDCSSSPAINSSNGSTGSHSLRSLYTRPRAHSRYNSGPHGSRRTARSASRPTGQTSGRYCDAGPGGGGIGRRTEPSASDNGRSYGGPRRL